MVSPRFAANLDRGVGDSVTFRLYTPEQVDAFLEGGFEPATADGPAVDARIVGVVRSPWFGDQVGQSGFVVPSAGLYAAYRPNLVGGNEGGSINALVRLRGGEASIPAFKASLAEESGRTDIDVWNVAEFASHARDVTGYEAKSLVAFALAAGVAAVFLVGQSLARYASASINDLQVFQAMGMTPTEALGASAVGPTLAGLAGAILGAGGAAVASRWFPIGSASLLEPAPGASLDAAVLVPGAISVAFLVAGGAIAAGWVALRAGGRARSPRRSVLASAAARAGLPAPVVVGTRFALEPGRGRQAVPVRPELFGAAVGVLGTLGALTFSAGVSDAAERPERFGQTHHLEGYLGYGDVDFGPADELLAQTAGDADVVAVNDTRLDVAQVGDVGVSIFSLDPVDDPLDVVVTGGRLPSRPDEVALAPRSAKALGVEVGDALELTGTLGTREVSVTGLAFVPAGPHNDYATGAWVIGQTYDDLFDGFKFHFGLVALRPGAEPEAVSARVSAASEGALELTPPQPPPEISELQQVRALPLFLAVFLTLLALGAVGHALSTAVRRRRHDVASLRALGITRWQSRMVVVTQATVLAVGGLVIGAPLGVALGRTTWRSVAESTPLQYLPPVAWLALILMVPVALLAANALAVWPSQRAASLRVGQVLRTE